MQSGSSRFPYCTTKIMTMCATITLLTATVFVIKPGKTHEEYNCEKDLAVADFSKIVSSKCYVDKSLLIRDVFHDTPCVLVTAPRSFGKSVNIDMIKRFLGIEVDDRGNERHDKPNTFNYGLFTNLKIFKEDKNFFDKHFGKYPVVYIDYSPLSTVTSYEMMLQRFKRILFKTYREHSYLLKNRDLWLNEEEKSVFTKYADRSLKTDLTENEMKEGVPVLTNLLSEHFNKQVCVLIDGFDAHLVSLLREDVEDADAIINFTRSVNYLTNYNRDNVFKIFASGELPIMDSGLCSDEKEINFCPFLTSQEYYQYYGLKTDELESLLKKRTNDNAKETSELRRKITRYYNGYTVLEQDAKIYSPKSVLYYLETGVLRSYWSSHVNVRNIFRIFFRAFFKLKILKLLKNGYAYICISKPLMQDDVLVLSEILKRHVNSRYFNISSTVKNKFYRLLFDLGYLTPTGFYSYSYGGKYVTVKIPNSEIENEFLCMAFANFNCRAIAPLHEIVSEFSASNNSVEMFKTFRDRLENLFNQSSYTTTSYRDFSITLFLIFRLNSDFHTFETTRLIAGTTPVGIWVKNRHNVSFIIETKLAKLIKCQTPCLDSYAQDSINKIIQRGYFKKLVLNKQSKVVYLGLGYNVKTKRLSLKYSKNLLENDNINETLSI